MYGITPIILTTTVRQFFIRLMAPANSFPYFPLRHLINQIT